MGEERKGEGDENLIPPKISPLSLILSPKGRENLQPSDEAISTFGGVIGLKVMRLLRFTRNDRLQSVFILRGTQSNRV